MKQIKKQLLNKGFKSETLQSCKAGIIEIKLGCSATGEEKKAIESNKREFNNESKTVARRIVRLFE
jgi:hypothetical protein